MGYEIHEKKAPNGSLFRVWNTGTDSYWHKPLSRDELENALLEAAIEQATCNLLQQFKKNELLNVEVVTEWFQPRKSIGEIPEELTDDLDQHLFGAKVSVNIHVAPNGVKTITATIVPLAQKP